MKANKNKLNFILIMSLCICIFGCASNKKSMEKSYTEAEKDIIAIGVPYWLSERQKAIEARRNGGGSINLSALERLDEKYNESNYILQLLNNKRTHKDANFETISLWLRWRVLARNADSREVYAYSSFISEILQESSKSNPKNNTAMLYAEATFQILSRLSLEIDAARCADSTSLEAAKKYVQKFIVNAETAIPFELLPPPIRKIAYEHAISIEKMRGERPQQFWICQLGIKSIADSSENFGNVTAKEARIKNSNTITFSVNTSKAQPDFISNAEWRKRREHIISDYTKQLAFFSVLSQ